MTLLYDLGLTTDEVSLLLARTSVCFMPVRYRQVLQVATAFERTVRMGKRLVCIKTDVMDFSCILILLEQPVPTNT